MVARHVFFADRDVVFDTELQARRTGSSGGIASIALLRPTRLLLVTARRAPTTSAFEFASLRADVGLRVGARNTRSWAKVLLRFAGLAAALDQDSVLACGGSQGQLVESDHLAASLQDAGPCSFGRTQGADLIQER